MNINFIIFGSIEIVFSIIVAVISFFLGFKALSVFTKEYDDEKEIKNNNIAVAIISAMFLICIGISLRVASGPAISTLRNALMTSNIDAGKILVTVGIMILHLALGGLIAILSLFFTIFLLTKISPFKDLRGIMNNNIALAIIIGSVMLVTTLLISDPLLFFLEGFIPNINLPSPGLK
jgi:uncharacterized membrane protein YjfL (UPF0719 family)